MIPISTGSRRASVSRTTRWYAACGLSGVERVACDRPEWGATAPHTPRFLLFFSSAKVVHLAGRKQGGWRGGGREVPLPAPTRVWRERTALSPPEKSPAQTGGRGGQAAQAGRAQLLAGVGGDAAQLLHQRLNQRLSTANLENKTQKRLAPNSCSRYGARTHDNFFACGGPGIFFACGAPQAPKIPHSYKVGCALHLSYL